MNAAATCVTRGVGTCRLDLIGRCAVHPRFSGANAGKTPAPALRPDDRSSSSLVPTRQTVGCGPTGSLTVTLTFLPCEAHLPSSKQRVLRQHPPGLDNCLTVGVSASMLTN